MLLLLFPAWARFPRVLQGIGPPGSIFAAVGGWHCAWQGAVVLAPGCYHCKILARVASGIWHLTVLNWHRASAATSITLCSQCPCRITRAASRKRSARTCRGPAARFARNGSHTPPSTRMASAWARVAARRSPHEHEPLTMFTIVVAGYSPELRSVLTCLPMPPRRGPASFVWLGAARAHGCLRVD